MQYKMYNTEAKEIGSVELNDEVFGWEYNEPLIHQAVVSYLANQRQGTKSTLTRSEVRGGGVKPWRQKGTGRARQGSIRSPQWIHGGVVFAPKPRDFSKKMNKQMKRIALLSAFSTKFANTEITVLDKLTIAEPKTKLVAKFLKNFAVKKKTLIVVAEKDDVLLRAAANIPNVSVTTSELVNTYDLVANTVVFCTQDALKKFEEAYN